MEAQDKTVRRLTCHLADFFKGHVTKDTALAIVIFFDIDANIYDYCPRLHPIRLHHLRAADSHY